MIRELISFYRPSYPKALVYMLQSTEYRIKPYLYWYWHTNNFSVVEHRRSLDYTGPAKLLLAALYIGMTLQFVAAALIIILSGGDRWAYGVALAVVTPVLWAHIIALPMFVGHLAIIAPRHRTLIHASKKIFAEHPGIKIAVAGSYGKTSMKELLLTVLSEGKTVAATPANKNVSVSHAYFAAKLTGKEDIVIIEYGEGKPGDVTRFAKITHPTHAVITGIAPAHLDQYKTLDGAAKDIFSVGNYVEPDRLYVNEESPLAQPYISKKAQRYSHAGALGWKVTDVKVELTGMHFALVKGAKRLVLQTKLVGRHHLGPLSLAAALAHEFGLTDDQIKAGIAKTAPYEHRMQPYQLADAWIIDDTYNGNIEGVRAGTALLHELPAKRKIYVTPGLVDQGMEGRAVHEEMGKLIAAAKPDVVVLMKNSATHDIQAGLEAANYSGGLVVQDDPLDFYRNLPSFVAAGDVVLMQNDWTDNYL
ncbi:MAG TPA: Mur ligase family protein [Candidatus Saccharimonadales bacterium]|nr:Mur ligase family protein [Candidatus Saccharimonadales bacterium]